MKNDAKKNRPVHNLLVAPILRLMDKLSGRYVPAVKKKRAIGRTA